MRVTITRPKGENYKATAVAKQTIATPRDPEPVQPEKVIDQNTLATLDTSPDEKPTYVTASKLNTVWPMVDDVTISKDEESYIVEDTKEEEGTEA